MGSPTRFVLVPMSEGEAGHVLECLRELDGTDGGIPERAYELIDDALEESPRLTIDQLNRVQDLARELGEVSEHGDD